jgi:hypothetical protein
VEQQRPLQSRQGRRPDVAAAVAAKSGGALKQGTPRDGPQISENRKMIN